MANIAEGFSRYSFKDSKQFFMMSRGSLAELRSHMYIAVDQEYVSIKHTAALHTQIEIVGRLISDLIRNSQRQWELSVLEPDLGTLEPLSE